MPQAVEWAHVVPRPGRPTSYIPLKSGTDPAKDFINGKTAILYNGIVDRGRTPARSSATTSCSCRRRTSATARRSVAVPGSGASSTNCGNPEGALEYLKFAAQDKYVARVRHRDRQHPGHRRGRGARSRATRRAGRTTIFRAATPRSSRCSGRSTPGYPFIATEFTKTAQDILNGADPQEGARPGRQEHRRQPRSQRLLRVSPDPRGRAGGPHVAPPPRRGHVSS